MCKKCEQQMTVEQVLQVTVASLQGIMIPVEMSDTVGTVVSGSIRNLRLCIEAMERDRMQQEAAAAVAAEQADKEALEEETDEREADAE